MQQQTPIVKTLNISFSLPIYASQIPRWRGAFIELSGLEKDILHNHNNQSEERDYHYRYPMVQYRCVRGKAAIFALEKGVDEVQQILANNSWILNWDGEERPLKIDDIHLQMWLPKIEEQPIHYQLNQWLALNPKNYAAYEKCANLRERIDLLERLLTNHILATCYAMDWKPEQRIEVTLQHIRKMQRVSVHGSSQMAFNLDYSANVSLPPFIGIGKSTSLGFGWNVEKRELKDPT